jgi:DNA invertase Pin-like site-specific DNA recombinase
VSEHPKLLPQHRERLAYVYIRQSSPGQVKEHLESQALQYQLAQRAQALGWPAANVVVIDDDLGKSAISSADRPGFQTLVAEVALGRAGIILVTDVSRLARNCSDWYQLLDLASLSHTLIGDASGIYDPRIYDDRLLLGLKGAFSEAQWYHMRTHLYAALLNKAKRGELAIRLPVGYHRTTDGSVAFTPDRQVQDAIRLVFDQFARLGSARAVLRYFCDQHLDLPYLIPCGPRQDEIEWRKPKYAAIYRFLSHPAYAGAYTYGKHHRTRLPGAEQKIVTRALPMEEWPVLIQDAFPGYITWEQYLHNQERLHQNAQGLHFTRGAPRSGAALLQGIVRCGRCGRPLHTRYEKKPAYACHQANQQYGAPYCQHFTAPPVDEAVVELFFQAVQPACLEAALAALEQVEAQRRQLAAHWQQRLERARYEVELARQRYECVDPRNRLVAADLELRWEEKLQAARALEQEWAHVQARELTPLTETDRAAILRLAEDVPLLWSAESTTHDERKRLLRCLVADVTLDAIRPGLTRVRVRWHTGATSAVEITVPRAGGPPAPPALIARIRELAQRYPDDQIPAILNAEGTPTARNQVWTTARVRNFRNKHRIPTACPYVTATPGPRGDGMIKVAEAAARLDVTPAMINDWFRRGLLVGHQRQPGSPLWVRMTDADVARLDGSAALTPDMLPLSEAATMLGITAAEMVARVRDGWLLTFRVRVGHRWRWLVRVSDRHIQPADSQSERR